MTNTNNSLKNLGLQVNMNKGVAEQLLTDAEVEYLIVQTCQSNPDGAATQEEIERVIHWARCVRLENVMLGMVFKGDLVIKSDPESEDGIAFGPCAATGLVA